VLRPGVVVAPLTPDRCPDFVSLWVDGRVELGASHDVAARFAADGRIEAALARPGVHCLVATRDDRIVGYLIATESLFGLSDATDLAIEQMHVVPDLRRTGVAKELLGGAVQLAERIGAERVVGNVPTAQRDANRFFARLGFGSSVTRRVTTTAALRRRVLGGADVSAFDQMLRRRRSLRASRTRSA
jgi:GNAT superfamily N-acetyltransferase